MAVKSNAGVNINREMVEAVFGLTNCILKTMEEQVPEVQKTSAYLASEDNVGGTVAKSFRESNDSVRAVCDQIMQKTAVVSSTMSKFSEALHVSFTATQKSTEEARASLNAVVAKAKTLGS